VVNHSFLLILRHHHQQQNNQKENYSSFHHYYLDLAKQMACFLDLFQMLDCILRHPNLHYQPMQVSWNLLRLHHLQQM